MRKGQTATPEHRAKLREAWRLKRESRTVDGKRRCLRCEVWFPATTGFYHRSGSGGKFLHSYCKPCTKVINKANRDAHPDVNLAYNLRARFGITPGDYDAMFEAQGGVCAICGRAPGGRRLGVDHDHASDAIRGLLCNPCNAALGALQDDPALLRRAADYIEERR